MIKTKEDFTYRQEHTGSMAVSSGLEYICNIVQRMFYLIPGLDDYETSMGLDITTRATKPYEDGYRDSDYEQEIVRQFITYTDIIPSTVMAVYRDRILVVSMMASYNGEDFQIMVSSDPTQLSTQVLPKVI